MRLFILIILLIIATLTLPAQTAKEYISKRVDAGSIPKIDGNLSETAWENANWGNDFVQYEPQNGAAPLLQTYFAILYDDNNLYVAIRSLDSEPDRIVKRVTRRDNLDGDWVGINIDSYADKLTAFSFYVTAAGSKTDFMITNNTSEDESWDPVWHVKTQLTAEGWNAEIQIPYSQIRFGEKTAYDWGLQLVRFIYRNQEKSMWQPIEKGTGQFVGKFGRLTGIHDIKPRKDVEIYPFTVISQTLDEKEEGNPFRTGLERNISAGVDGKYSLTNDITLTFTVNPDFGQVEADPADVNLTAFETYFSEKRPFFVEGSNIFQFPFDLNNNGINSPFYSRRIGRNPQIYYDAQPGEYVRMPNKTNILGALKISGKTRKGTSIGIMDAVTQRMVADIDRNSTRSKSPVEPLTNYAVVSLEQDLDGGNTIVGGMLTATNRQVNDPEFATLPANAYTGGVKATRYWKDKAYYATGRLFYSDISGTPEAITWLQKQPIHYFQRPDADHLTFDTQRTSLRGHGGSAELGKMSGHFNYILLSSWSSPGLDFNDVGFKQESDMFMYGAWVGYSQWNPTDIYRSYNTNGSVYRVVDFAGRYMGAGTNTNGSIRFKNYYSAFGGFNTNFPGFSTGTLRGGPALQTTGNMNYWIGAETDNRKKLTVEISKGGSYGWQNATRSDWYEMELSFKPGDRFSMELTPYYSKGETQLQYVRTVARDDRFTYLMARLDRATVSLSTRLNFGITPDMTIQFYAQPYLFSGDYSEFKYITDPKAKTFTGQYHSYTPAELSFAENDNAYRVTKPDAGQSYGFSNPDFHFLQFRSNLVFRWEYKPGSTLFLVWAQGRNSSGMEGDFRFGDYSSELFTAHPRNDFLIKVSYAVII